MWQVVVLVSKPASNAHRCVARGRGHACCSALLLSTLLCQAALLCEAGLEGQELVFATQTVLHLITSIAQSEFLTRETPRAQNREFAETIRAQLPEGVEKSWPATRARDAWSIDFDALFEYAMRNVLASIVSQTDGRS